MIFPTLLKVACAGEGCVPVVEVWDGNVKDIIKLKDKDIRYLKGQYLEMATDAGVLRQGPCAPAATNGGGSRGHGSDADNEGGSDGDDEDDAYDEGTDTGDDEGGDEEDEAEENAEYRRDVEEMVARMATEGTLPFQGGIHAYEVFLVPFLIIIVSTMHFGRQCALIAPQMKILRPRAIVVANRAKVQHAAPAQNGWTRRITSSDDLTLHSQRSSQLVIDELQPIWNTFMCSREVHGLGAGSDTLDGLKAGALEQYRTWFMEDLQEALNSGAGTAPPQDSKRAITEHKLRRYPERLKSLSLPGWKRFLRGMHKKFSSNPAGCHKTDVRGGCSLGTCGCTAAITTTREQLTGQETPRRIAHAAIDGKILRSPVLVHDNSCGLATAINTAYEELRQLSASRCGAACSLEELLAWKAAKSEGEFPWNHADGSPWRRLHRQCWSIFTDDEDRAVLDIMEKPGLLNEHPLIGCNVLLCLIDRFHEGNHTSLTCETFSMRLVRELKWVISQNVEHRWRQKSANLGHLHSLHPEAHEVVQMLMDWGWCKRSFERQLRELRKLTPTGCDLAYNVFQQVVARCEKCGSPAKHCVHTGSSGRCATTPLPNPPRPTLLHTLRRLVGSFNCQCGTTSEPLMATAATDLAPREQQPSEGDDLQW